MLVTMEPDADFSRGCMLSMIRPAFLLTHPAIRAALHASLFYLARFLPTTAVNKHSLLPYLVLGNKLQSEETGHPSLP